MTGEEREKNRERVRSKERQRALIRKENEKETE
jgi:hypothetical protein